MELKEFIQSKWDEYLSLTREAEILKAGLQKLIEEVTFMNVKGGTITNFKGTFYEVIDQRFNFPYNCKRFKDLRYEVLCLKAPNKLPDDGKLANRIRSDHYWYPHKYSHSKQKQFYDFHSKNVIILNNHFTTVFI